MKLRLILTVGTLLGAAAPLPAQTHPATAPSAYALLELPALVLAVVLSFLTARALRGGRLGQGMALIAWGFLVMAIGHLHMQGQMLFGVDLLGTLFGPGIGRVAWVLALLVTWTLTSLGFYRLYRASSRI